MTITIDTPTEVEAATTVKVKAKDLSAGSEAETDAARAFPPGATYHGVPIAGNPLAARFAQWAADDPVTGPEDLAQRQCEGDEFMAALQANRFTIPQDPELVAIIEKST